MFFRSASGRAMSHCAAINVFDVKLAEPDLHLAAFDLGQVENVVDHVQAAARPDFWMFCT